MNQEDTTAGLLIGLLLIIGNLAEEHDLVVGRERQKESADSASRKTGRMTLRRVR